MAKVDRKTRKGKNMNNVPSITVIQYSNGYSENSIGHSRTSIFLMLAALTNVCNILYCRRSKKNGEKWKASIKMIFHTILKRY